MESYEKIWEQVLKFIKDNTTEASYNTWFKEPLSIKKIDKDLNIVYLQVNSSKKIDFDFIINILKNRYMSYLQMAFKTVLKDEYRIVLKKSEEYEKPVEKSENTPKPKLNKKILDKQKIFNPKFNFDNFVVGSSNKLAHAAALAVAESPSETMLPLAPMPW